MRFYREMTLDTEKPEGPTTVPIALAGSANDFFGIRRFADVCGGEIAGIGVEQVGGTQDEQRGGEVAQFEQCGRCERPSQPRSSQTSQQRSRGAPAVRSLK